jgi:hypothetical protein
MVVIRPGSWLVATGSGVMYQRPRYLSQSGLYHPADGVGIAPKSNAQGE